MEEIESSDNEKHEKKRKKRKILGEKSRKLECRLP